MSHFESTHANVWISMRLVESHWGCIPFSFWAIYFRVVSIHVHIFNDTPFCSIYTKNFFFKIVFRLLSGWLCHNFHAALPARPPRYWCFYKSLSFTSLPSLLCLCLLFKYMYLLNETIYVPKFIHVAKWRSPGLHPAILFSKDILRHLQSFVIWRVKIIHTGTSKEIIISPINIHNYYLCRRFIPWSCDKWIMSYC